MFIIFRKRIQSTNFDTANNKKPKCAYSFSTLFLPPLALICTYFSSLALAQQQGSDISVTRIEGGKITSTNNSPQNEGNKSFTDTIRVLRVSEGEWDVFFDNQGGPYSIPQKEMEQVGTYHEIFKRAYEDKVPIQVTVNTDTEQVLSISKPPPKNPAASSRSPASEVLPPEISPDKAKMLESVFGKHFNPNPTDDSPPPSRP